MSYLEPQNLNLLIDLQMISNNQNEYCALQTKQFLPKKLKKVGSLSLTIEDGIPCNLTTLKLFWDTGE